MDAISLSMANLGAADPASAGIAATTIVIAAGANTLVKSGIVVFAGTPALRRLILMATGILLVVGAALLVLA